MNRLSAPRYNNDSKERSAVFERCFVVLALVIFSGGFIPVLTTQNVTAYDLYSPLQTYILSGVFLLTLVVALPHANGMLTLITRNVPLLLFLLLQFAAVFWAEEPMLTLNGAIAAALTTIFGLYIVSRFRTDEYIFLLAAAFALMVIGSILFVTFLPPSYGYQATGFAWKGVFVNRNSLGSYSALSCIIFTILTLSHRKMRGIWLAMAIISMMVMLKTFSKTPLISIIAAFSIVWLLLLISRLDITRASLLSLAVAFAAAGVIFYIMQDVGQSLELVGRNENLSGRTDAWRIVIGLIFNQPVIGYGTLRLDQDLLPAHNMWLTIWLKNGGIGLFLFGWLFVNATTRAVVASPQRPWPDRTLFLVLLVFLFFRGFAESLYFSTLPWVLLVIAACTPSLPQQRLTRKYFYVSFLLWALAVATVLTPVVPTVRSQEFSTDVMDNIEY